MIKKLLHILRSLLGMVSTLALVTIIAALIWLYAERQGVKPREVDTLIRVSPKNSVAWSAKSPTDTDIHLKVRFESNGAVEQQVKESLKELPLFVDFDGTKAGPQHLDLKPLIEETLKQALAKFGATLLQKDAVAYDQPTQVNFTAEAITEQTLPLEVDPSSYRNSTSRAAVESVKVQLPLSAWQEIRGNTAPGATHAFVTLADIPPGKLVLNQPARYTLQIHLPGDWAAKNPGRMVVVSPPITEVETTIKEDIKPISVKSLPVLLLCPPALMDKWQLNIMQEDQFIPELGLEGTELALGKIKANALNPVDSGVFIAAHIATIEEATPDGTVVSATLDVILPEGVRLTPEWALRMRDKKARITLTRRPAK